MVWNDRKLCGQEIRTLVRGFVRYRTEQFFDLEPDSETCARLVNFLSDEIDKLQAKKEQI